MGEKIPLWVEFTLIGCKAFIASAKMEYKTNILPQFCEADGAINEDMFRQMIADNYSKHETAFKLELDYKAGEELDSHKRGACIFYALMDISPYGNNSKFFNEMFAISVAHEHVQASLVIHLEGKKVRENILRYFKTSPFFRDKHMFPRLCEEKRTYEECLQYTLYREYIIGSSMNQHNYSMLALLLYHFDISESLKVRVLVGPIGLPWDLHAV